MTYVPPDSSVFTRRQTLWMMAGTVVLGSLVGCGGSGGGSASGFSLTSSRASTAFPAGFSIPLTDLKGDTAFGSNALGADGTFGAKFARAAGPTFAWVRHSVTGKPVLFGFVGDGQKGVSAKSTAVAMMALAIGIGGLRPKDARDVVALLEGDPAVETLAGVIAAQVVANPYAVAEGDEAIRAAVSACAASLKPGSRSLAMISRSREEASRAEPDPLLLITPGVQSGSNVVQKTEPASIYYVNNYRRPAVFATYKVGYATDAGDVMLNAAAAVGSPTELPPVQGILTTIISLNAHPLFAPIESPRVRLDIKESEKKAYYQTVCLMASGKSEADGEPAFFSLPRYSGEVAQWRKTREELNRHAWIGGVLYDLFASVVGGAASWVSLAVVADVVAKVRAAGGAASQAVLNASAGQIIKGTETCIQTAIEDGDGGVAVREAIAILIARAQSAGAITTTTALLNAIRALAVMLAQAVVVAGAVNAIVDLGFTYDDLLFSEKGVIWDETLAKSTVALSADRPSIKAGGNVNLNVSIVGGKESDYRFKWKVRGGNGVLGEVGKPNAGQDIETTTTTVNLLSAPGDQDGLIYVVTVEAIEKSSGASLGIATKSVKIENQASNVVGTRITHTDFRESGLFPNRYDAEAVIGVQFVPKPGARTFILKGKSPDGSPNPGTIYEEYDSPTTFSRFGVRLDNTLEVTRDYRLYALEDVEPFFERSRKKYADWTWTVQMA